jgi:sterol desaturase/sphingolipid hydroxylase (fatty acid hydroxylase superfamily)
VDLETLVTAREPVVRLTAFLGVLAGMAAWELAGPRRRLEAPRAKRWLHHAGLVVAYTLLVRALFPLGAVAMALAARERGFGLLLWLSLPGPAAILAGVLLLDLAIYLQHVLFHAVPALWRLHMVHHADLDVDATTGLRFHPVEIVLSMLIKLAAVAAIGPPVVAVIAFEVVWNATSMFNHGNVRIPERLDRVLRLFVVTPDVHRVHHSTRARETNSNYGFNFPWWDRLAGSYRPQPEDGHERMRIGLDRFPGPWNQHLGWILLLPFRRISDPREHARPSVPGDVSLRPSR